MGILAGVSIVHNFRGLHPHAPVVLAAVEEGAAVHDLEQEKLVKYVPVSARHFFVLRGAGLHAP
jgi:hypothetical protein